MIALRTLLCALILCLLPPAPSGAQERVLTVVSPWEVSDLEPLETGYVFRRLGVGETLVEVEPDGRRSGDPFVGTSSGNTSFDQAALRAVEMTASLPPVPAKYPNGITASIKFVAKEAL